MPNRPEEKLAVEIVRDHLKEEEDIHIERIKLLTKEDDGEPPDCCFEIGDLKIGCEVRNFNPVDQPAKIAQKSGVKRKATKSIQRYLQEKGFPSIIFFWDLKELPKRNENIAEEVVNLIVMTHTESIARISNYYRLKNLIDIAFAYSDVPDGANIDEKYKCLYHESIRSGKPIKVEEMQKVITCKNKDIPRYKKHCDQKWLIITNRANMDFFRLEGTAKEAEYKCDFDRVFYTQRSWIDPTTRKKEETGSLTDRYTVYELKVKR